MTRFTLRIAGTTFHVTTQTILVACALLCSVLIMSSFISTLRVAVQRGESLREAQRAGSLERTFMRTASNTPTFDRAMTPALSAGLGRGLQAAVTSRP